MPEPTYIRWLSVDNKHRHTWKRRGTAKSLTAVCGAKTTQARLDKEGRASVAIPRCDVCAKSIASDVADAYASGERDMAKRLDALLMGL